MKAAIIHQFGSPDVLRYEEIATPEPRPGHVVIKVLAAGVNRFDHYIREGSVTPELPFPHVLGADAAGEIAAIGDGVAGFTVGERVVPLTGYPMKDDEAGIYPISAASSYTVLGLGIPGTYAQFMEIPARWVLKDNTGLAPGEVSALPMAVSTAVRAVKVVGEVKAGDDVLVTAGASGVGTMQIQVARALGARVAATVRSESKIGALKDLGANRVINTQEEDMVRAVQQWTDGKGADVVIDNVGGDLFPHVIDSTRGQGMIVAVGFLAGTQVSFDIRNFFFGQKQLRGTLGGDIEDLRWGLEQVRAGKLRPALDRTLPLSEAAEAHRLVSTNQITGSVALLPWAA